MLFFIAFFDVGRIACVIEPKKRDFSENSCGLSTESGALFLLSSLLFLSRRVVSVRHGVIRRSFGRVAVSFMVEEDKDGSDKCIV